MTPHDFEQLWGKVVRTEMWAQNRDLGSGTEISVLGTQLGSGRIYRSQSSLGWGRCHLWIEHNHTLLTKNNCAKNINFTWRNLIFKISNLRKIFFEIKKIKKKSSKNQWRFENFEILKMFWKNQNFKIVIDFSKTSPDFLLSQKIFPPEIWNFENQISSCKINIFCSDLFCEQGMVVFYPITAPTPRGQPPAPRYPPRTELDPQDRDLGPRTEISVLGPHLGPGNFRPKLL